MALSSRVYSGWEQLETLGDDWQRISRSCTRGVHGPDATTGVVWAKALAQTHLKSAAVRALCVSAADQVVAVVPTYTTSRPGIPFVKREMCAVTQAYGGRPGLLIADQDPAVTAYTLSRLRSDVPDWDVFIFGVVEDSAGHRGVLRATQSEALQLRCIGSEESPYIELRPSWEEVLAALPKKMRWTIRKCESELSGQGQLDYEEIRDPESVGALMEAIYAVERNSWKEQSGSSITALENQRSFYQVFAGLAARGGILSAHVLRLNRRPIAYILGVAAGDGVFLDLKESFDSSYSEFSPGHVLKRFAFQSLIARGTCLYDFMGRCEAYKMRWTDRTYRRLTYAYYNTSIKGAFFHLRSRFASGITDAPRNR